MDIKTDLSMEKAILETAESMFLNKGFAATSTTQIAKQVGCNQALVHYYFRTKENLFNVIFEQKFKLFFENAFDADNLDNLKFIDKLKYIIESHFDILSSNPKMPVLIINELARQPHQIEILRDKLRMIPEMLFKKLNEELKVEIEHGRIRDVNLLDLLISMISLNVSLFIFMPILETVLSLDSAQKEFLINHRRSENVEFILKSLRP